METWAKIRNYKCFGEDPQGFESISLFNIIVGRNNSGKSSLLDLVAFLTKPYALPAIRSGTPPEVLGKGRVDEKDYRATFPNDRSRNDIGRFSQYGMQYLNKVMTWRINERGVNELVDIADATPLDQQFSGDIVAQKKHPLRDKVFKRLSAERDIMPEENAESLELSAAGAGATNIIQHYLNDSGRPSDLVEIELLTALNAIFEPDAVFSRIRVQRLLGGRWEVFLDEHEKGRVALSDSGSGLKTVILILLLLIVIPHLEKKQISDYVYALEELENNTHPALQRRLLLYLHRLATKNAVTFFLTTHSTVAIDFFSRDRDSQIIHVTHDRKTSRAQRVWAYEQNRVILDDLDIRASDMLQSNGVVWLEGPSDRLYFRRWIELWSNGALIEGIHYQCIFYGGKLLKHISCDEPGCDPCRVQVLTVNRNAMMLIDNDVRIEGKALTETKQRVIEELEGVGGFAWVTAGKEIENYIPESVLTEITGLQFRAVAPTETLWELSNSIQNKLGDKLERDKIGLAETVAPKLTRSLLENCLDLPQKLTVACRHIARWNSLSLQEPAS